MTLAEFVKTATMRGLANKDMALEYGAGRTQFTEADLEAVYRYQNAVYAGQESDRVRVYQGVRCTVRKN
jgi:hypothetical protein